MLRILSPPFNAGAGFPKNLEKYIDETKRANRINNIIKRKKRKKKEKKRKNKKPLDERKTVDIIKAQSEQLTTENKKWLKTNNSLSSR